MAAKKEITDEIRHYLAMLISEVLDRNRDHLKWLEENPEEPDRDLQRAESERAIERNHPALNTVSEALARIEEILRGREMGRKTRRA